ncbi:MAG TPA: long-chain-fatty-acid--CoA ligase [Thermaerobacter sp.]
MGRTASGAGEGLALNLIQRVCVGDILTRTAQRYPDKVAIADLDGGVSLTYAELNHHANRVARSLLGLGLRHQDMVAIMSRNTWQFVVTYFACAKAGLIALPVNLGLKPEEIAYVLRDAGARVIVAEGMFRPALESTTAALPAVERVYLTDVDPATEFEAGGKWFLAFDRLLAAPPGGEPGPDDEVEVFIDDRDTVQCLYTSGTTSLPKGVLTSHLAVTITALSAAVTNKADPDDVCLVVLPIFHCAALNALLLPTLLVGGTAVFLRRYEVRAVMDALEKHKVTHTLLLPMMWQEILQQPDARQRDFSSVRRCLYAMAPMAPERIAEIQQLFPNADVVLGSGQTEFTPPTVFQRPHHQHTKPASWGLPTVMTDVRIMDDHGNLLPRGQVGEIVYRGPQCMTAYWNNPEATAEAFRHGWFHSGDVGWMDEEGVVWFTDRKKDMVKTGGENVSSIEVERALLAHPAVAECAVVGLPHERWGEAVTAFVVPKPGASVTEEELIAHCRERLAGFKVPKKVVFVSDFPRTGTGKIQKHILRQHHQALYNV